MSVPILASIFTSLATVAWFSNHLPQPRHRQIHCPRSHSTFLITPPPHAMPCSAASASTVSFCFVSIADVTATTSADTTFAVIVAAATNPPPNLAPIPLFSLPPLQLQLLLQLPPPLQSLLPLIPLLESCLGLHHRQHHTAASTSSSTAVSTTTPASPPSLTLPPPRLHLLPPSLWPSLPLLSCHCWPTPCLYFDLHSDRLCCSCRCCYRVDHSQRCFLCDSDCALRNQL